MMVRTALCLTSPLALLSSLALAQQAAPSAPGKAVEPQAAKPAPAADAVHSPAAPAPAPEKMEKKGGLEIKPYAFIEGYMILSRSGTAKTPAYESGRWYVGLKGKQGIANLALETSLTGPYRFHDHDGNATVNNAKVASEAKDRLLDGFIGIRKAEVFLNFPTNTELHLGRVRPSGASFVGADAAGWSAGASGFGSVDGLMARQRLELDDLRLGFGMTIANTLNSAGGASIGNERKENQASPYSYLGTFKSKKDDKYISWSKADRAYVLNASASFMGAELKVYYGKDPRQIQKYLGSGSFVVADYSQAEASLVYDIVTKGKEKLLTAGLWWENDVEGRLKKATVSGSGRIQTGQDYLVGNRIRNTIEAQRFGLGVEGHSGLFDLTDLIQKDDKITYGVSFEYNNGGREIGLANPTLRKAQNDREKQVWTGSVGYQVGGLDTVLGVKHEAAAGRTLRWADLDGTSHRDLTTTYLKMAWWME